MNARVEVTRAVDGVGLCIKDPGNLSDKEILMDLTEADNGRMAFTTRAPIGSGVAVLAFNQPLNLVVHQVALAIATRENLR